MLLIRLPVITNEVSTPSFSSISEVRAPLPELPTQNLWAFKMLVIVPHVVTSPKSAEVNRILILGEAVRLLDTLLPLVPAGCAESPPDSSLSTSMASQEIITGSSTVTVISREGSMGRMKGGWSKLIAMDVPVAFSVPERVSENNLFVLPPFSRA